jgi:hypothetical protein
MAAGPVTGSGGEYPHGISKGGGAGGGRSVGGRRGDEVAVGPLAGVVEVVVGLVARWAR